MKITFVYRDGIGLGIGYLASYLEKSGHTADLAFQHNTFSNMYVNIPKMKKWEEELEDSISYVVKNKPDLVGFSVASADYLWALETASRIKSKCSVPIIFGGYHPTLLPEMCINNRDVDMICLGEGEEALTELLNSMQRGSIDYSIRNIWFKRDGQVRRNPLRPLKDDLDRLPFPNRDIFFKYFPQFWKREIGFILASRGCPFSCSYCGNEAYNQLYRNNGKILRLRSPENVLKECLYLKGKYRVKKIHFQDDLFASDTSWLEEFIPRYKKEVSLPFTCLTHPLVMSARNIEMLKEGGCRLAIVGIQSGSERVRREIFNRRETNRDIEKFAKTCHQVGLNFSFNHIFDAPTDDQEEVFESARFYNMVRPNIIDSYVLVYFPKARIIDRAIKEGILIESDKQAIEEGRFKGMHQGGFYNIFGKYYQKYSMLFVLIPLLPQRMIEVILENKFYLKMATRLPIKLMPIVKTILNLKCGSASFHIQVIRFNIHRFIEVFAKHRRRTLKAQAR